MRRLTNFLLIGIIAASYSCQKERVYPKVQLVSAEISDNDSVILVARIAHFDKELGENVGFAFHTDSTFRTFLYLPSHQKASFYSRDSVIKHSFHTNLFNAQNTYYFKAFVQVGKLYIESNVLQLSGIETQPVIAPCQHPENRFRLNNGLYTTIFSHNSVNVSSTTTTYTVYYGNGTSFFNVTASSPPRTGIYITTNNAVPQANELRLRMHALDNFVSYAPPGGLLYVNQIDDNRFRIEACGLPFQFSASSLTILDMNMRLTYQ